MNGWMDIRKRAAAPTLRKESHVTSGRYITDAIISFCAAHIMPVRFLG
jgi:hypothetical protein